MELTVSKPIPKENPELSFDDQVLLFAIYASTNDLKGYLQKAPQNTSEECYKVSLALKNCLDYYVIDYKISQSFFNKVYKPTATDSRWHTWKFIYDYYTDIISKISGKN